MLNKIKPSDSKCLSNEILFDKNPILKDIFNFLSEVWIYFIIELKHVKSFAIVTTLFSMIIPFGVILMISMMPMEITKDVAILYISGNLMASISNICIVTLAQVLSTMRVKNGFEHLASLPIFTVSPMLGTFLSFFVTTLPSLIVMPLMGMWLFKVTFEITIWLVIVIILTIVTMIGIGASLGTFSDNYRKTHTLTMIVMFFVMFATPLYYPMESLPQIVIVLQRLLPFSYSLEAMRSLMVDPFLNPLVIKNIVILVGWMILSLGISSKFVTWRQRD